MDNEDRDLDKKIKFCKPTGSDHMISLDHIKSLYIASGLSPEEISKQTFIPLDQINSVIREQQLYELRKAYIRQGISKIQNEQITQAQKLMDVELNYKKLRIIQLEDQLKDFLAYYARYGDFYKRHPITGDIMKNTSGMPLQITIPNVSKEITQLKDAVTLSEGLKNLIYQLDDILNTGKPKEKVTENDDVIDINEYDGLFKKNS